MYLCAFARPTTACPQQIRCFDTLEVLEPRGGTLHASFQKQFIKTHSCRFLSSMPPNPVVLCDYNTFRLCSSSWYLSHIRGFRTEWNAPTDVGRLHPRQKFGDTYVSCASPVGNGKGLNNANTSIMWSAYASDTREFSPSRFPRGQVLVDPSRSLVPLRYLYSGSWRVVKKLQQNWAKQIPILIRALPRRSLGTARTAAASRFKSQNRPAVKTVFVRYGHKQGQIWYTAAW